MGNSTSKSSPSSATNLPHNDAHIPTRRPPRRKESLGTAGHSISKGHAAAPAASLESSHSTSQNRSAVASRSRGRSQTNPTAQQRLQDIVDDDQRTASSGSKHTGQSTTPDRSRSPRPPLNVDTSAPALPDLDRPRTNSSNKSTASGSPTPYFLPSSQFGRPPRLPLPIEEEIHAPDSPVGGSPLIRPADFEPSGEQNQTEDDIPRSKSALSSTTADEDEDEDVDGVMYKTEDMKGPLVSTLLEWRDGGEKVYVTGTFCAWVKKSRLHKNGPNKDPDTFSANIGLPPGTHHLTFFVDGVPTTARHMPTAVDYAGSLVNYIEVPSEDTAQPVRAKDIARPHREPAMSPSGERRLPTGFHPPMTIPATPELKPAGTTSAAGGAAQGLAGPTRSPSQKKRSATAAALKRTQEEKKKYHSDIPRFLLDWDAPEGSSRVQRAGAVMQTQPAPPSLPMFLTKSILSMQTPMKDDASVLAYPNHTVLNHLATSSIKDEVLATSATTRYKSKFVTTIVYRPTSDETDEEANAAEK